LGSGRGGGGGGGETSLFLDRTFFLPFFIDLKTGFCSISTAMKGSPSRLQKPFIHSLMALRRGELFHPMGTVLPGLS